MPSPWAIENPNLQEWQGDGKCENCLNILPGACGHNGNTDSDFVILGESPGNRELCEGEPFYPRGTAGRNLRNDINDINDAEVNRDNINEHFFILNSINCNVNTSDELADLCDVSRDFWRNEQRKKTPTFACRSRVQRDIFSRRRKLILAFGNQSLWTLTGDYTARVIDEKWRKTHTIRCPNTGKKIYVVFTCHPVLSNRNLGNGRWINYEDIRRADIRRALELRMKIKEMPYWRISLRMFLESIKCRVCRFICSPN